MHIYTNHSQFLSVTSESITVTLWKLRGWAIFWSFKTYNCCGIYCDVCKPTLRACSTINQQHRAENKCDLISVDTCWLIHLNEKWIHSIHSHRSAVKLHYLFFLVNTNIYHVKDQIVDQNVNDLWMYWGMEPNHYLNDQPIAIHPSFKSVHNIEKRKHLIKQLKSRVVDSDSRRKRNREQDCFCVRFH